MFNTIIAAIDGSTPSQEALRVALGIARAFDADLHVIHSPQVETALAAEGYFVIETQPTPEQIAEAGKAVMEAARQQAGAAGVTLASEMIAPGEPADGILEMATHYEADLVVMGRRGLGSVASLFLGSVSQRVSTEAPCSVLTVAAQG